MSVDYTQLKGLFFDIYATLIDWEAGVYPPLLALHQRSTSSKDNNDATQIRAKLFSYYHDYQVEIWAAQPGRLYPLVLEDVYARIAQTLGVEFSREEQVAFGRSIGDWPAFPDTVRALQTLSKYYKLFVLSNVDNASFERTRTGPLQSAHWDGIYTAQMIGSYKPDPKNYLYVAEQASKDFSIQKDQLILVAQSLDLDHVMTKKLGFKPGVWINRQGSYVGVSRGDLEKQGSIELGAEYSTLGEFANAVELAFKSDRS